MGRHLEGMEHDGSWTFSTCEFCMKNAGDKVRMNREKFSGVEMWVCPQCGSSKSL